MARPGAKRAPWRENTYGVNRWAWLVLGRIEIVVYDGNDPNPLDAPPAEKNEHFHDDAGRMEHDTKLKIRPIRLSIKRGTFRPLLINLTHFRVDELKELRRLLDMALDEALKRAELLDADAQERFDNGDDTLPRLYRPIPQIIERPGVLARPFDEGTMTPADHDD